MSALIVRQAKGIQILAAPGQSQNKNDEPEYSPTDKF
jgi:hypothetical protein